MIPTNNITVEMTDKDVQDNLISIVESMERIRKESITNLGTSDEQKMDYLRLTGELASCLKPFIEENKLEEHANAASSLVDNDLLLRSYDPYQADFWNERQPGLKTALDDCTAVLLRDDFVSESQIYHIFQALKYLSVNKENRDDVYETILPYNSLLNENSLTSSDISSYLIKQLINVSSHGAGVRAANIDIVSFVKSLEQAGAFYADIPKEFYQSIRKEFPKTILVEDDGKYARVIFGDKTKEQGINAFKLLQEYAQLSLESEEDLVKKMSNFYGFGKKFLNDMKSKIGVREDSSKPIKPIKDLERVLILVDDSAADNGNSKTQNQWIEYWHNIDDGRRFASAPDLYQVFKQLKAGEEKDLADSLRQDFNSSWIVTSTRLIYQPNALDAKIIHNYGNKNPALIKESDIKVPTYLDVSIASKANDEDCLTYLRALFDTKDNMKEIISVLEYISDKPREKIKLWTPPLRSDNYITRKGNSVRAARFYYSDGVFHVNGNFRVDNYLGRSRGVLDSQRS